MKGEGSNDFDINELDKKIREQKNIVSRKEDSQNPIKKNPKASLAIASIVFAALVIGMIATFGGVGMIDGALLGKVILTAVTAGTAAFGAKKLYDTVKGDKDKHQLRKLEKTRDSIRRMKTEEIARQAKLGLDNIKEQARDREEELTDAQKRLHDAKKEALESAKELLKTQTQTLNSSIASLSMKLGISDADSNKTEDLKKLLSVNVKKSDGADLDTSSSSPTNGNLLKEVLQAGLGLGSDDTIIAKGSPEFIDPQGRITILKGLNDVLANYDSANSTAKFKTNADRGNKEVDVTLNDLKCLVDKEKKRTSETKDKSVGRRVG